MEAGDIERARASVLSSEDSSGKTRLLKILAHSEQLLNGTQKALQAVGQNTESVPQFFNILFEIREILKPVYDLLLELDVVVMEVCFSREGSYEAAQAVVKVIRTQSRELDELLWCLPRRRSATDSAADARIPTNAVLP